jgi:hypothetical protein
VKVLFASLLEDLHWCQLDLRLFHLFFDLILDFLQIFTLEEVVKLADIQNSINVFKKHFFLDVLIREHKHSLSVVDAKTFEQVTEVFLPLVQAVVLVEFDLKLAALVDVDCQSRHRTTSVA